VAALATATASFLAALSGCADLLGANFDDGHLKTDDAGEQPDTSNPSAEAGTEPTTDAGDGAAFAPHVVLFGGAGRDGLLDDTWTWDATTWTHRDVSPHPSARRGHVMATLGRTVVLFGGMGANNDDLGDTWVWDGLRWEEKHPAHTPPPTNFYSDPGMATQGKRVVLQTRLGATWTWDGKDWTQVDTVPSPKWKYLEGYCTATSGTNVFGIVVALSGPSDGGPIPPPEVWSFDKAWSDVGPFPVSVTNCAMTGLPDGRLVFFTSGNNDSRTWEHDKSGWLETHPTHRPRQRAGEAMTTFGGKPLLFGGTEYGVVLPEAIRNDTWVYDQHDWIQRPESGAPASRTVSAMAAIE
jgi:hypothetical protein